MLNYVTTFRGLIFVLPDVFFGLSLAFGRVCMVFFRLWASLHGIFSSLGEFAWYFFVFGRGCQIEKKFLSNLYAFFEVFFAQILTFSEFYMQNPAKSRSEITLCKPTKRIHLCLLQIDNLFLLFLSETTDFFLHIEVMYSEQAICLS